MRLLADLERQGVKTATKQLQHLEDCLVTYNATNDAVRGHGDRECLVAWGEGLLAGDGLPVLAGPYDCAVRQALQAGDCLLGWKAGGAGRPEPGGTDPCLLAAVL